MKTIAALYVETDGCYFGLDGVEPWDIKRDARTYDGPHPVVAHPPCKRWGRMARMMYATHGHEHLRPGNDGGCFKAALDAVRKWGGVLEHPAGTQAFREFGIPRPFMGAWHRTICGGWVTEVAQCQYGHKARKLTWLYLHAAAPPSLDWRCEGYTHMIGPLRKGVDTDLQALSRKENLATPQAFRDILIKMARSVEVKP